MILPLLIVLASQDASPRERNQACQTLLALLQERGRWLAGRSLGASLSSEDLEDVIQFVLTQASVGTARCKAESEGQAWAWCRTIAHHFAINLLKRRKREQPTDDLEALEKHGQDEGEGPEQETKELLDRAITEATRIDPRILLGIQCAVEYRFQAVGIEAQIERWGFPDGPPPLVTPLEKKRARDRVYTYRKRGLSYLTEALDRLERAGELTPIDTVFLRSLLAR